VQMNGHRSSSFQRYERFSLPSPRLASPVKIR
jgi:hypothetical protein